MFSKQQVSLKIQSQGKIKRIRDMPSNFQALKAVVEAQLADEGAVKPTSQPRNYTIKYQDASQDWINVSDDEDVLTSIDVAQKELQGTLKYVVAFKQQALEEPPKATAKKAKKAGGKKKKAEEDLQRAATTVQPQHVAEEPEEETPSSAEEEKDDSHTDKPKKLSKKASKLPPRNALKKLISKELEQAAPLIFAELTKIKDLT